MAFLTALQILTGLCWYCNNRWFSKKKHIFAKWPSSKYCRPLVLAGTVMIDKGVQEKVYYRNIYTTWPLFSSSTANPLVLTVAVMIQIPALVHLHKSLICEAWRCLWRGRGVVFVRLYLTPLVLRGYFVKLLLIKASWEEK